MGPVLGAASHGALLNDFVFVNNSAFLSSSYLSVSDRLVPIDLTLAQCHNIGQTVSLASGSQPVLSSFAP